jgi:hypothetical protein
MKTISILLPVLCSFLITNCFAQHLHINKYFHTPGINDTKIILADSVALTQVSSIMLSESRFSPYSQNRPANFFSFKYSCDEISAGWLIGGLVGGAIGYWAGINYTSGKEIQRHIMGDFILQGMQAGAHIGDDIQNIVNKYDFPENDFINNMDYYHWLQTIQNGD